MKSHVAETVLHVTVLVILVKGEISSIVPSSTLSNDVMENTTSLENSSSIEPTASEISVDNSVDVTNIMNAMTSSVTASMNSIETVVNEGISSSMSSNVIMQPSILTSSLLPESTQNSIEINVSPTMINSASLSNVFSSSVSPSSTYSFDANTLMTVQVSESISPTSVFNGIVTDQITNSMTSSLEGFISTSLPVLIDNTTSVQSTDFSDMPPIPTSVMTYIMTDYSSLAAIQPTSTLSPDMTSSTIPAPTTPVPTVPTTSSATDPRPGDKDNAVFKVKGTFEVNGCISKNQSVKDVLRQQLQNLFGFESVRILKTGKDVQCKNRRKRDADPDKSVESELSFNAKAVKENPDEVQNGLNNTMNAAGNFSIVNPSTLYSDVQELSNKSYCDSENYCENGFTCAKDKNDGPCYYLCDSSNLEDAPTCKNDGTCVVRYDYDSKGLKPQCRCTETEYYRYEGDECETEKMTWRLVLAIAGGVAGAIIIILLFIIIIVCIRTRRDKYGSSEDYSQIDEDVRMQNFRGNRKSDDKHLYFGGSLQAHENQTYNEPRVYDNKAYDMFETDGDAMYRQNAGDSNGQGNNWDPSKSANIYAKLNTTFEDENYQNNIKRPHVSSTKRNTDGVTGF